MMMMLDDVFGSDEEPISQEQDSEFLTAEDPILEWEETEIRKLTLELSGRERLPTE
jgi:hypothetical protein